jgi:hypothetical protein
MTHKRYTKEKDLSAGSVYARVGKALDLLQKASPALMSDSCRVSAKETVGPRKSSKQAA